MYLCGPVIMLSESNFWYDFKQTKTIQLFQSPREDKLKNLRGIQWELMRPLIEPLWLSCIKLLKAYISLHFHQCFHQIFQIRGCLKN